MLIEVKNIITHMYIRLTLLHASYTIKRSLVIGYSSRLKVLTIDLDTAPSDTNIGTGTNAVFREVQLKPLDGSERVNTRLS